MKVHMIYSLGVKNQSHGATGPRKKVWRYLQPSAYNIPTDGMFEVCV